MLGIVRFILEFGFVEPACGSGLPDPRPEWIKAAVGNFHYLHYAAVSFVFTSLIIIAVSIMTEPFREDQVKRRGQICHATFRCLQRKYI